MSTIYESPEATTDPGCDILLASGDNSFIEFFFEE